MRLDGSKREPVQGAIRVGRLDRAEQASITIVVRRRVSASPFPDVGALGRRIPSQRSYLTREQFAQLHGADPNDLDRVTAFARAHDLKIDHISAAARTVRLTGPADLLGRLFDAPLERWGHPGGGTYRGRVGYLTAPSELDGIVVAVLGLDDRPQSRPHFRRHLAAAATDVSYTPPVVGEAYDYPVGTDGTGQTIGILELGGGFSASDLTTYFGQLGIPVPTVTAVSVDGVQNAPTGDPDGPDGEVELDIEVAGALAPGAQLVVYFAPNTDQGFLDGLTQAIHDTTNHPSVLSISWGAPESSWTAQALSALNGVCEDAATMGITIVVAAGDGGASDGVSGGGLAVDFPASSPYVMACGGTRLLLNGSQISSEVVWNDLATGEGATGGGVSQTFPLPSFQANANVPAAPNGFVGRGVPDVAGNADPASGYSVLIDGSAAVIGGTSAVAPLWAALIARINQSLGTPAGFLDPTLYLPGSDATFHDITSGDNDGYSAGPGWDPCTGWGSPDGSRLLESLRPSSPPS